MAKTKTATNAEKYSYLQGITPDDKVLSLVLKGYWYNYIEKGDKREEYREIKPYWVKILCECSLTLKPKAFTIVEFRLGYSSDAPRMYWRIGEIKIGHPVSRWTYVPRKICFIIPLKERIFRVI